MIRVKRRKVLFVWELGGHLGHILNMLPLACELHARGFEVAFALRELARAHLIYERYPQFELLQAPCWNVPAHNKESVPQSLAQVLQCYGYLNAQAVEALARAWLSLYAGVQPDLVVYDYSFTAQLAYRGLSATQVTVGSGFFTPTFDQSTPPFWPERCNNAEQLKQDEAKVLDVINAVCERLQKPSVRFISDLNQVDANFLSTIPELDHYGERAGFTYTGPLLGAHEFQPVKWSGKQKGKRIFAYLKPGELTEKLLSILAHGSNEAHIFMPGLPQRIRKLYESNSLHFTTKPFDIRQAAEADFAICNGGHGTVAALLLEACPMLLLPQHAEQYLLSKRTDVLGVSETLTPDVKPNDIQASLGRLIEGEKLGLNARKLADKYEVYHDGQAVKLLAEAILVMMK